MASQPFGMKAAKKFMCVVVYWGELAIRFNNSTCVVKTWLIEIHVHRNGTGLSINPGQMGTQLVDSLQCHLVMSCMYLQLKECME